MARSAGRAVGERSGGRLGPEEVGEAAGLCASSRLSPLNSLRSITDWGGGGILVSADAAAILGGPDDSTTRSSGRSGAASWKNSSQTRGSILLGEGAPSIADPGPTDPSCLAMAKATCSGLTSANAAAAETPSWDAT